MIVESSITVKLALELPNDAGMSKKTAMAPVKPLPWMVTAVPPLAGPKFGVIEAIAGGGATYVNRSSPPSPRGMTFSENELMTKTSPH
jgi:hypothetical protein